MEHQLSRDEIAILLSDILKKKKNIPSWVFFELSNKRFFLERKESTDSYIDFLETQISLAPRGKEWNEILKKRKEFVSNNKIYYFCRVTNNANSSFFEEDMKIYINANTKQFLIET